MTKKLICCALAICLMCITASAALPGGLVVETSLTDGGEVVVMTVPDTQGMAVNAQAAVVMEAKTGRVLFEQNSGERLPFASTTKIMTALIALEQPELDTLFEVDPEAIRVEGSSMGLQAGDKVTLRVLAAGMLLPSGNDAANSAAVRISGSIPAFVEGMNKRAKEIGMENTSFETPSGLDGEMHYSTAYDLALLAREAMKNQQFADICSQYKLRVSYGNPPYDRWLTNHNRLLNYYDGATGMKTGFTKKAGRCLVSTAQRDGVELICVTLDCPDDWNTHEKLFDRYFEGLELVDLAQDIPAFTVPVTGGVAGEITASPAEAAEFAVSRENPAVEYSICVEPFLYAPVEPGQIVGQARIVLEGDQVAAIDLVAVEEVAPLHPYEEEKGFLGWLAGLFG